MCKRFTPLSHDEAQDILDAFTEGKPIRLSPKCLLCPCWHADPKWAARKILPRQRFSWQAKILLTSVAMF